MYPLTTKEEQDAITDVKDNSPGLYKFYEFVDSKAKWSDKLSSVYFIGFDKQSSWRSYRTGTPQEKQLQFRFYNSGSYRSVQVNVKLPSRDGLLILECKRETVREYTAIHVMTMDPNCSFAEVEKFIDDGLKHFRKLDAKNKTKKATEKILSIGYQSKIMDVIPVDAALEYSQSYGEYVSGKGSYHSNFNIKKLKTKEDTFTVKFSGIFNLTEDQLVEFIRGYASGYPKKKG